MVKRTAYLFLAALLVLSLGIIYAQNSSEDNSTDQIVGSTCGTVSPDSRDVCCQGRGFDSWNEEKGSCINKNTESENDTEDQEKNESDVLGSSAETKKIVSRATCRIIDSVEGYYDIRTNKLILENSGCQYGSIIICKKNGEQGWYDLENKLVKTEECPDYEDISELKEAIKEKNRIKFTDKTIECPDNCFCKGSVVRCEFENGTRIMTIYAGKSGNVIVQIKGENMTTSVTLYKSNDKVYGIFAGNETREVKVLPDQVAEKIKDKIKAKLQNKNITLDENGTYEYEGEKRAKLFLVIPVKGFVNAHVDSETGIVSNIKNPWWSFLAKDEQ